MALFQIVNIETGETVVIVEAAFYNDVEDALENDSKYDVDEVYHSEAETRARYNVISLDQFRIYQKVM